MTEQAAKETGPDEANLNEATEGDEATGTAGSAAPRPAVGYAIAGVVVVLLLGALTRYLSVQVPKWGTKTSFEGIAKSIEYPVYAIALGLIGNVILTKLAVRDALSCGFRTEFFIKTGLVLLGASINLKLLVTAAGPAIIQALLLISIVFGFTWWLSGKLVIDDKLRALLASAVSICGVSAAIAAAGAVQAKKEQLAYAASLVIAFALPSIFLLPWLASVFGLPDAVAGAWIGGNIDTTAAVTAAGSLAGKDALAIATIVKTTQNALIGFVAIALTAYFALKVERKSKEEARPTFAHFWERFPKFVLGFVAASVIGTLYLQWAGPDGKAAAATIDNLRVWFLTFAFVAIGLEFSLKGLREAGWRPVVVFASATVVNIVVALGLALVLFGSFQIH